MEDSKTFCILPFVHMHIDTTGYVKPCCVAPVHNGDVGKLSESSLEEIFNNDKMKQLRLDLANGVARPDFCSNCYKNEKAGFSSSRKGQNYTLSHMIEPALKSMQADGYLEPKIKYWDTRYSNLCNLKCRTCGDDYSTTWSKENADNGSEYKELKAYTGEDPLAKQYENVEKIYFAGGEPLIMPEHYDTLRKVIDKDRAKDVELFYNTNMTKLNYNKQYLPDLWKEFKLVKLGLSIDATGARADYIRNGSVKCNKIEQNISTLKSYSNITHFLSPTISMMNVYTITDMHRELFEKGLMHDIDHILFNILHQAPMFSVKILPRNIKEEIQAKIKDHIVWIKDNNGLDFTVNQFQNLSDYLNEDWIEPEHTAQVKELIKNISDIDAIRNESFPDTFPEYKEWWEEITKNTIHTVEIT